MKDKDEAMRESIKAMEAIEEYQKWFEANVSWLTKWATHVVMISRQSATSSETGIFQTFAVPIPAPPPIGLLIASDMIKEQILTHAVFGHKRRVETPDGKGQKFPGFIQRYGRLPTSEDVALFTAYEWSALYPEWGFEKGAHLVTTCSVEFLTPGGQKDESDDKAEAAEIHPVS